MPKNNFTPLTTSSPRDVSPSGGSVIPGKGNDVANGSSNYSALGVTTGRRCRTDALNSLGSVVYAARFPDGTIKIGHTQRLGKRLWDLTQRYGMKSELLAFQPGGYDEEQALHAGLVEHRSQGREWYHPAPEVLAVVNSMRKALNMPHIAA